MKTLRTIFIALTLLLTLSDAHTHQNRRGYRHSRRHTKPRRKSDPLMTDLHHASLHGRFEEVKSLLQTEHYRRKINVKNDQGQTPLHLAALKGHFKIVKLLIENEANINAESDNKKTPLHLAVLKGHLEAIRFLIENGANVNAQKNNGETALNIVVTQKHKNIIEIIKHLFLCGADITLTCTMPATKDHPHKMKNISPLHAALLNNQPFEIIQTLVEFAQWQLCKEKFKTFINAQMSSVSTALHIAINQGQKETIKYLLKNNADVTQTKTMSATKDKPEIKNVTPLNLALLSNQPFEIIQLLIEHAKQKLTKEEFKIFINSQMSGGSTALHIAINQGQKETIKYLLKNNADVTQTKTMNVNKDKPEIKNITPLNLALLSNQPFEIIQLLIEHAKQKLTKEEFKTFINAQTNYGQTALHTAVNQGQKETIKYLLENGANPNIQTIGKIKEDKIRSPFQILIRLHEQSAIKYDNQDATRYSSKKLCELIPLFLEYGAHIDLANKKNQTTLYWIICTELTNELKVLIENSTQDNNLYEALKIENTEKTKEFGKTIWETLELFYNPEIIDILVNTKNKDRKTLINIARERNDQEVLIKLQSYQHTLELIQDLKQVKYYDLFIPKKTFPKYWLKGIVYTLEENIINDEERYLCYEHNNLKLRYDYLFRTLQYRSNLDKNFKTMRSQTGGFLYDKQVTMFVLRHKNNRKFYYWYQNNKLKFRQSGTQQTYNLKLKS